MDKWKRVRFVLIDETEYLQDKPKALRAFGTVYAYFPDVVVNACEITPSYELWPLRYMFDWNFTEEDWDKDYEKRQVLPDGTTQASYEESLERAFAEETVAYRHCSAMDRNYREKFWRFNDCIIEEEEFKDPRNPLTAEGTYEWVREMGPNNYPCGLWFDNVDRAEADRIRLGRLKRHPVAVLATYTRDVLSAVEFVYCAPWICNSSIGSSVLQAEGPFENLLTRVVGSNQAVLDVVEHMEHEDALIWLKQFRVDPHMVEEVADELGGLPFFQTAGTV